MQIEDAFWGPDQPYEPTYVQLAQARLQILKQTNPSYSVSSAKVSIWNLEQKIETLRDFEPSKEMAPTSYHAWWVELKDLIWARGMFRRLLKGMQA